MRRHHRRWLVASGVRRGEELIAAVLLMLTGPSLSIESDPSHGELVRKSSLGAREVVRVHRTTPKDVAKDIVKASRTTSASRGRYLEGVRSLTQSDDGPSQKEPQLAKSVARSARSGRFVTARTAARSPKTTVHQTVPSKAPAIGPRRFVSNATAAHHTNTTIS